jgi:hypothetical protein
MFSYVIVSSHTYCRLNILATKLVLFNLCQEVACILSLKKVVAFYPGNLFPQVAYLFSTAWRGLGVFKASLS